MLLTWNYWLFQKRTSGSHLVLDSQVLLHYSPFSCFRVFSQLVYFGCWDDSYSFLWEDWLSIMQQEFRCYHSWDTLPQVLPFLHISTIHYLFGNHRCLQCSLSWIRYSDNQQSQILFCKWVLQSLLLLLIYRWPEFDRA